MKKMPEAWALWDKVCADDRIAFLAEREGIEMEFRRLSALRSSSPKVWADAYLLAFASIAGLRTAILFCAVNLSIEEKNRFTGQAQTAQVSR